MCKNFGSIAMKRLLILLLFLTVVTAVPAQRRNGSRRQPTQRERLQADREKLRREREANQRRRKELEEKVKLNMVEVEALAQEISEKQRVVDSIRTEMDTVNARIGRLDVQLQQLQEELEVRRQHYIHSLRYMYRNRRVQNQMMFVLSAKNLNQMYRRMRFMNEYTTYQKAQGEAVKQKREQVDQKQQELTVEREQMSQLLAMSQQEQNQLASRQATQRQLVEQLQQEKQTVQTLITQQQKREAELNKQIDRPIAEELERARKAEEERQRKLAEERRRREEQAAAAAANRNNNNNPSGGRSGGRGGGGATANNNSGGVTAPFNPAMIDQQLSGSFASNKGRLPVPITGAYRLIRGFGPYTFEGVTLNSNGIHLQGQAGAKARCVFDGEVSKVYHPGNTYIVMVRHGRYISVYCNLSSVTVSAGQKVKTNQTLGDVASDHVLQFRLHNWNELLNPKHWLSKLH